MQILNEPFAGLLTEEETETAITDFHMSGFISWRDEPIEFRSGMKSHVLVGGREDLTEHPFMLRQLGALVAKAAFRIAEGRSHQNPCLIGIPMTGNTLAASAAIVSERNLPFFVMRQTRKKHGAHKKWVDGAPYSYDYFVTVDNTITDGGSKIDMIKLLKEDGFEVRKRSMSHLALVDRGIGGPERLRARRHDIHCLFELPALVRAFVERKNWPQDHLEIFLKENEQNRLA